jgi:hypothetical protein
MTGITEQPPATAAEASADYQKTIRVKALPGALFDALTAVSGLTAWWTPEATRPTSVRWTVTECSFLPDWVGTHPVFTITGVDGESSDLNFRHYGLTPELDCIDMCTRSWNHFLVSLGDYVETGHGSPLGSPADKAWRAE